MFRTKPKNDLANEEVIAENFPSLVKERNL